jgi:hypothetical protein
VVCVVCSDRVACGVWGAAEIRVKDAREEVVWCVWCGREDGPRERTPGRPGYGPSSSRPCSRSCSRPFSPLGCKRHISCCCQQLYCGRACWSI